MAIAGVEGGEAFQLLAKMTSRLASMADLDDIATLVSDEIAALGFGAIWVAVLDEPTGHLITVRELIDGRDTTQEMPRISILDMRQPIGHGFREAADDQCSTSGVVAIIEDHPEGIPRAKWHLPRVDLRAPAWPSFCLWAVVGQPRSTGGRARMSSYRGASRCRTSCSTTAFSARS